MQTKIIAALNERQISEALSLEFYYGVDTQVWPTLVYVPCSSGLCRNRPFSLMGLRMEQCNQSKMTDFHQVR